MQLGILLLLTGLATGCFSSRTGGLHKGRSDTRPAASIVSRAYLLIAWKISTRDGPDHQKPEFDDSSWSLVPDLFSRPHPRGLFWLRKTLELPVDSHESDPVTITFYNLPSAFEVYWDGRLLGKNGRVGSQKEDEIPGSVNFMRIIGQRWLQKGNHTLAIRVSNFHVSSPGLFRSILMGPWSKIQSRVRSRTYPRLIFSGLFFLSAFLSFFFYLRRSRDPSLLFFGLYAVSVFLHAVWILLVETVAVPTPLFSHMEPLEVVTLLMAHVFLLGFVIWHFKIRRPWMLLLALAGFSLGGLLLFRDILRAANASMLIECLSAFLIAVFMTVRRRRGGQLLLMATLSLFSHRLVQLFPGLSGRAEILPPMLWSIILQGTSLFFFLAAIALRIRDENRALHALQLRSRRLEAELLKKTIQPHFIMNTLLSIKSWYLSDPAKGEMLIEALAEEFRIISRVASERTIELCEELDLCRAHLDLMGYRCDVTYTLEVHGACTGIMVPPLLLHTLIENGLTHAFSPRENGNFRFECRTGGTDIVLLLENDGSLLEGIERGRELEEGMGLTYVRTRLEECYPGNWDLAYGISAGRWMVRISIRNKGGA